MGWKVDTPSKNKSRNLTWHLEISEESMVDLENFMVIEGVHAHKMHVEKKNLIKREKELPNLWTAKKQVYIPYFCENNIQWLMKRRLTQL